MILLDLYSLHHISHLHHLTPGTPYHDKHHVTSSSSLKMVWFQQKVQGACVTKLNDLVQVFATILQGFQLHKCEMYYIIKRMLECSKISIFSKNVCVLRWWIVRNNIFDTMYLYTKKRMQGVVKGSKKYFKSSLACTKYLVSR